MGGSELDVIRTGHTEGYCNQQQGEEVCESMFHMRIPLPVTGLVRIPIAVELLNPDKSSDRVTISILL